MAARLSLMKAKQIAARLREHKKLAYIPNVAMLGAPSIMPEQRIARGACRLSKGETTLLEVLHLAYANRFNLALNH